VRAPKLQSQTIFENFAQALPRRPAVNSASKWWQLRYPPTKGRQQDSSEASMLSSISCDCKRFRSHFVPASGRRVARDMGRLNAGVRNSEAFAKTRSRELALRTCSAFLNKLAEQKRRRRYSNDGAGKCRWSWENETSDPKRESKCALYGIQAVP
jgi:hypothetical protein